MRKVSGYGLFVLATFLYALCVFFLIMLSLELWKAQELLNYFHIRDKFFAYRGATDVVLSALLSAVLARLSDHYAKKIYPKLRKGPWSITLPR
ncbi:MAG: hypothetical protein QGF09_07365 [Rhodospirillales bacterium]|nr:hypothetical protein [Rhodospirillales bacterium]